MTQRDQSTLEAPTALVQQSLPVTATTLLDSVMQLSLSSIQLVDVLHLHPCPGFRPSAQTLIQAGINIHRMRAAV